MPRSFGATTVLSMVNRKQPGARPVFHCYPRRYCGSQEQRISSPLPQQK
jgi:hypothetical protein